MKNLDQKKLQEVSGGGFWEGILETLEDWLLCGMGGNDEYNCPK